MSRSQGYNNKVLLKKESSYGTSPAGNYINMPYNSCGLGASRGYVDDPLAGAGREPLNVFQDVTAVSGDIQVPMDMRYIGHWLTGLLGNPTSSGSSNYTHTFKAGGSTLPSYSIEEAHPDVPEYLMHAGCKVNSMTLNMERVGPAAATFNILGKSQTPNGSSQAGTPSSMTLARASQFQGSLKKGGSLLANVTGGSMVLSNNLQPIENLTADGTIDGIDAGQNTLTGNISTRFADTTLFDLAVAATALDLEFAYTISATLKLVITIHEAYLDRITPEIQGPGGVNADFAFRAVKNTVAGTMCTIALYNDQAGTVYTS